MTEKYVGSDLLYMAGSFANIGEALKQIYPPNALDKIINAKAPWRNALEHDAWTESLAIQLCALLGETDLELGPDTTDWMADLLERKQMRRKQLDAWRDGTLQEYEAERALRRKADRLDFSPVPPDHSSTERAARKAQQPRRRPRLRARSST